MKIGIDLGTTFSVVARYDSNRSDAVVVTNEQGLSLTPSVLCFTGDPEPLAGWKAHERLVTNDPGCVTDFKKTLGLNGYTYVANGVSYTSTDLYIRLYRHLLNTAVASTGEKVEAAVITVPAYFNDIQRNAARYAASSAGINVLRVVKEPVAAAICYGYRNRSNRRILVYDLGGGTVDVTVCDIRNKSIEVVDTKGDHMLGGNNWDEALLTHVCSLFNAEFGVNPEDDPSVREGLLYRADSYKRLLSDQESVEYEIEYKGDKAVYTVTREDFETITSHLMASTLEVIDRLTVDGAPLDRSTVDEVLLTGGSTRMPCIRSFLERNGFHVVNEPVSSDADTAVAKGAALACALYSGSDTGISEFVLKDKVNLSLGFLTESDDGKSYCNTILIPEGSPLPVERTGKLRIRENNCTDRLEIYVLQGESRDPADCDVIAKKVVSGFPNAGQGMVFDVTLSYDEEGFVNVTANQGGYELQVAEDTIPADLAWRSFAPSERTLDRSVTKELAFCVDMSRSMWPQVEKIKEFVKGTADALRGDNTTYTLIAFADKCKVVCGPGADLETFNGAVDSLKTGYLNRLGPGTAAQPLTTIDELLRDISGARFAVIVTDGVWESRDEAVAAARDCKVHKIPVYAVCYGDMQDESFIRQVASLDRGALYTTINNLKNVTDTIAVAIRNNPTGLMEML